MATKIIPLTRETKAKMHAKIAETRTLLATLDVQVDASDIGECYDEVKLAAALLLDLERALARLLADHGVPPVGADPDAPVPYSVTKRGRDHGA